MEATLGEMSDGGLHKTVPDLAKIKIKIKIKKGTRAFLLYVYMSILSCTTSRVCGASDCVVFCVQSVILSLCSGIVLFANAGGVKKKERKEEREEAYRRLKAVKREEKLTRQ